MGLFRKSKPKVQPADAVQAIAQLNQQAQLNLQKEDQITKQINEAREKARAAMKAGQKNMARQHLQRAKMLEGQLTQVRGMTMTLQQQAINLEGTQLAMQGVDAMRVTIEASKAAQSQLDVDKVADLRDELEEVNETAAEINEILTQAMPGMEIDEGELDAELDAMDAECLDDALMNQAQAQPAVPSQVPQAQTEAPPAPPVNVDDELNALMSGV